MVARKNDIRFAGQITDVKPEAKAKGVKLPANEELRSGVAPPYAGHHPATGGAVHHIDHQVNNGSVRGVPSRSFAMSA